ncbi:hypothetical protein AB0G02_26505, partial [Actinosynnema sp. NPDC023658]
SRPARVVTTHQLAARTPVSAPWIAERPGIRPRRYAARLRAHAFAHRRSVLDVARDVLARRLPLDRLAD